MPVDSKTVASQDSAGFKLFEELYKKKRVKDGCKVLPKKELDTKIFARWKVLPTKKHKQYNETAIERLTRTPTKKRYISYSTRAIAVKRRARSVSPQPRRSRKSYQSRSPIRSRNASRSTSWSASSATSRYVAGEYTDVTDSYTDTVSSYYDEEECSDATSCSSIASSYDDLTETNHHNTAKPSTSTKLAKQASKAKEGTKSKAVKAARTSKNKLPTKAKVPVKRATKKATKKPITEAITSKPSARIKRGNKGKRRPARVSGARQPKPVTKRVTARKPSVVTKVSRARKPRAVTSAKIVPLRRTRATRSVNVKPHDAQTDPAKLSPPHQMQTEEKLKPATADEPTVRVGQETV